jgi:hypothetical protein
MRFNISVLSLLAVLAGFAAAAPHRLDSSLLASSPLSGYQAREVVNSKCLDPPPSSVLTVIRKGQRFEPKVQRIESKLQRIEQL